MADENPSYVINAGFYPEIAAGKSGRTPRYGKGRGRVMQKTLKVRGFSPNSVQREEMLAKKREFLGMAAALGATGGGPGPAAAAGAEILALRGGAWGTTPQFEAFGKHKDSYKYIGGTEEYKLYGDHVWWMYASRGKGNRLSDLLREEQMTGPQFIQLFHKKSKKMVSKAVQLAKEVFDQSWDVAMIEKEFESSGEMVAEEIGFEAGGFRYMSVDAAVKKELIEKPQSESSAANNRDMVKIDSKGNVVATYDVTEQTIDVVGMHGITQAPHRELVEAIKDLDPKNDEQMNNVRKGVITMFTRQAQEYNVVIKHLKTMLTPKGKSQDKVKWEDLLKKAKPKGKKKTNVKDLAKYTKGMPNLTSGLKGVLQNPVKIENYTMWTAGDKSKEQTSLEFIAHMLGTMSGDMNENFSSTHAIVPKRVYAIVPMKNFTSGARNLEFDDSKGGVISMTKIVEGENATIANHFATHNVIDENQRTLAAEQNHKFMISKANQGAAQRGRSITYSATADNLRNKGVRPATNISIPAGEKLETALTNLLLNAGPDLDKIAQKIPLEKYVLGKPKGRDTFNQTERDSVFWALPYLGVMQGNLGEKAE